MLYAWAVIKAKILVPLLFFGCLIREGQIIASVFGFINSYFFYLLFLILATYYKGFVFGIGGVVGLKVLGMLLYHFRNKYWVMLPTSNIWTKAINHSSTIYEIAELAAKLVSHRINTAVRRGLL